MEANKQSSKPCPKDNANPLSKLLFLWTLPIFKKGYSKPLEKEDLYDSLIKDRSSKLGDTLEKNYLKGFTGSRENGDLKQGSLTNALLKTLWFDLLYLGCIIIFNELFVKLSMPVLLGMLLKYFEPESKMSRETALWCAGGIVVLNGASAVAMNHYMVGSFHMGMRAKVACCSLVYRKALKLSRTALGESATGKIVNLLSNDVNRFDIASLFLHYLWMAPLVSLFVLYFLWMEIGVSGLVGILVVFTVVPIQSYTGKLAAKYRLQTALKTDERVRLMGEIISGVQVIKMYAWEKPFQILIHLARRLEIKVIKKSSYVRAVYMTFLMSTTRIAVFCVMISMVLLGQKLTAAKIFVVATYFNLLSQTMSAMFVRAIAETAEAAVAMKRLEKFLHNDEFVENKKSITTSGEKDPQSLANGNSKMPHQNTHVSILKGEAKWLPTNEELTLQIEQMTVKKGKLIGVVGSVGSGKSSLLQAILGELQLSQGSLEVNGSVSYACQEPWVFGASIRQNILFGMPYEKSRYNQVVRVCALEADFLQFPHKDQTLVGERGTSLSGGQKARVNLARAVYRNTDIYLLDDPLSAVDTHVGRQLFEQCIMEHLKHKTRILVTHQLHYLEAADHIVLLKNGKISMQGSFHSLSTTSVEYAQLAMSAMPDEKSEDSLSVSSLKPHRERSTSRSKLKRLTSRNKRSESITSSVMDISDMKMEMTSDDEDEDNIENKPQIAEAEASSKNVVEGSVLYEYFRAGAGYFSMFFIAAGFIICQIAASSADYWMSFWTTQEELRDHYFGSATSSSALTLANSTGTTFNDTVFVEGFVFTDKSSFVQLSPTSPSTIADNKIFPEAESLLSTETCMWAYSVIAVSLLVISFVRSITFYNVAMRSSQKLHDVMFRGVIRSPMRFFHTNPSGRIMNRFSKDMGNIDEWLPKAILDASQVLLQMVGSVVLASYSNPYFILPIAIISIIFMIIRKIYLKTSKNVKRLEGIARSPVFTHLNATLQGLSTIRAYGAQKILKEEFDNFQDTHTATWYLFIATSSAFGLVLDMLCLILVAVVTFSFLFISSDVMGGRVGLGISQTMSMTFMVQWGVRQSAEVANQLMAVERVLEYKLLPPENGIEPDDIDKKNKKQMPKLKKPPREWPEEGGVQFKNYSMKYTEEADDPYVLRDLHCVIRPREKVGIVGRTGAGKSSLISALFRLAYGEGAVVIDNVDTKDISLENLRRKISIIPQDPVLFSGTLRRNLDPFEEFSDNALWQALEEVELKESLTSSAGLEAKVMDEGSNFSVGQRQLVCLARALLRNNRLLMLDEATANVDPHTDSLIQKTIRDKFLNCTVLTVAHRLNTIMDSDKVLVMDKGSMVEFDHPYKLMQKEDGFLSKMVAETGNQNSEVLFSLAKESYFKSHPNEDIKMIDE